MPSTRAKKPSSVALAVALAAGVVCLVEPAAAQSIPDVSREFGFDPVLSFVGKLLLNLALGAVVLGVAPEFSRSLVDRIRSHPVESFLYGLLTYVAVVVLTVLLALTIVGLLVVVPGLLVLAVVGLVANGVAVVAVGTLLAESSGESALWKSLVVGAVAVSLLTAIPPLTEPVNFLLGTVGMGAIAARYWERR